ERADFFFFKQKTAYEVIWLLEFRRVLFRSEPGAPLRTSRRRMSRNSRDENAGGVCAGTMRTKKGADGRLYAAQSSWWLASIPLRSEERRVGKEYRRISGR